MFSAQKPNPLPEEEWDNCPSFASFWLHATEAASRRESWTSSFSPVEARFALIREKMWFETFSLKERGISGSFCCGLVSFIGSFSFSGIPLDKPADIFLPRSERHALIVEQSDAAEGGPCKKTAFSKNGAIAIEAWNKKSDKTKNTPNLKNLGNKKTQKYKAGL